MNPGKRDDPVLVVPRRRGSLTKYDPHKGLQTIAVAEAAETHYARAKDATKLLHAIRAKLTAQAQFVDWWDTQGPGIRHGAGRGHKKIPDRESFLPDSKVVHRWRKKLDADHFEATYETACARYRVIVELDQSVHVAQATGDFEWYSPADCVDAARDVLGGIDLDPASTPTANDVIRATTFYTRNDNSLQQPWRGRVWINPPYASGVVDGFAAKLATDYAAGNITAAVVLVNNATETEWFQTLAAVAGAICFPKGRLKFWRPGDHGESVPLQGQAVLYCGGNCEAFADRFKGFGFVVGVRTRE